MNNNDTPQKGVSIGIPGYTILSELGKGGMATVYLAIQECFGRKVALKVMDPSLLADQTFGERFLREARIVAGLSHPHIIAVYDVGAHENYHYIAMEYHSGGDLQERITQGLPPEDAVAIIQQTALALDYAHKKGYIHRDVKPDNILFREDGSAVLTDFGIAKPQTSSQQMTQVGKVVGTPKYMSPEQARGASIDSRSDIYSLGIVLFEALTGEAPFDGSDPIAIGIKHLKDPVPTLPPHLSSFQAVVDTVLEKDVDDRYQSGQEFINALDEISFLHADGFVRPPKGKTIKTPSGRNKRVRTVTKQKSPSKKAPWLITAVIAAVILIMVLPPFILPDNSIVQAIYGSQPESLATKPTKAAKKTSPTVSTEEKTAKPKETQLEVSQLESPTQNKISEEKEEKISNKLEKTVPIENPDLVINTTDPLPLENQTTEQDDTPETIAATEAVEATIAKSSTDDIIETKNADDSGIVETRIEKETPEKQPTDKQVSSEKATLVKKEQPDPTIVQLLNDAKIALENKRLTRPKNDSALSKFTEVLALDPSNKEAKKGLEKIVTLLIDEAEKAREAKQFQAARRHLANAKSIDATEVALARLETSINNAEKEEQARKLAEENKAQTFADRFRITGLLRSAEQDILQEKFTLPSQSNAYNKYKEVLKINANNKEARQGLANIKKQLPMITQKAVESGSPNAEVLIQQLSIINKQKAQELQKKL